MSYRCEHGKDSDVCVQCWEEKNCPDRIFYEPKPNKKIQINMTRNEFIATTAARIRAHKPWSIEDCISEAIRLVNQLEQQGCAPWIHEVKE